MSLKLSANFTLDELTRSATAKARHIDQTPPLDVLANLRRLALELEKVRMLLGGKPIRIHSGYRSPTLNAAVGGAKNSYHLLGLAADFDPPAGVTHDQAQHLMGASTGLDYDLILEEKAKDGAHWLHFQIPKDGEKARRRLRDAFLDAQGGPITRTSAG